LRQHELATSKTKKTRRRAGPSFDEQETSG